MEWPSSSAGHMIDIQEGNQEEVSDNVTSSQRGNKPRPRRFRDTKKSFTRHLSLATGFSVLKEREDGVSSPTRSGASYGGKFGKINSDHIGDEDNRRGDFIMFRTTTLSKQYSSLRERNFNLNANYGSNQGGGKTTVPAGRYFAALRGPELDQIKESEDCLLPTDEKWPFLLRFPINGFGICLGLSSQAILWQALATSPATQFLHVTPYINLVIWVLGALALLLAFIIYLLKAVFYFEAVRREYCHPVRANFFFAPLVGCMFIALGMPKIIVPGNPSPIVFCVFMTPTFLLELKMYGEWFTGGKRRLSKVANPASHLSVVGNFVGALLAAEAGWKEPAKFLWAIGFAHYLVVFVTLYQNLPTITVLPKDMHPVYSMFIATPSAASISWCAIYGDFDALARTFLFIGLFIYISLYIRIKFFTGFRFSLAWWAYTFPMTTISLATVKYADQVPSVETKVLALALAFMSTAMVLVICACTLVHGLYWHTLFPNDLAIAISRKRSRKDRKQLKKLGAYNRRWAKQSPLPSESTMDKNSNTVDNEEDIDM